MTDAATALPLIQSDTAMAAAARRASPKAVDQPHESMRRPTAPGGNDLPRAPQARRGEAAERRQSFAAALESADTQATPAAAVPTDPDTVRSVTAAVEATDATADATVPLPLFNLLTTATTTTSGNISLSGGNAPPASGNVSPAPGGPARFATANLATTTYTTTGADAANLASTQTGALTPAALDVATEAASLAPRSAMPHAGIPTGNAVAGGGTDATGDPLRADSLRAGILNSFAMADNDTGTFQQGGDAQTGDGRRQLPDGLLQRVVAEQSAPATGAQITAEFSLNAGPATAPSIEMPYASALPGADADFDLLSGQRVLQPLGDQAQWSRNLGQRLLMMSDGGVQMARIKLHPEHLGQLDVRIEIEDNAARVWFNANSTQTREAIESALPKLREMFDDKGLELVRADVSDDSQPFASDREALPARQAAAGVEAGSQGAPDAEPDRPVMRVSDRLVDLYA